MHRIIHLITFFIFIVPASAQTVHPLHWYIGMNEPKVQLMVHAPDLPYPLAEYNVSIMAEGVSLKDVNSLDNPNYQWLDLHIESGAQAQNIQLLFEHSNGHQWFYSYALLERKPNSAQRIGFSSKDVIYLLTPDRFINGDPTNDNIEGYRERANPSYQGGRHGGDIQGMINAIDYLSEMGFTQVWTMPLLQNDMAKYSYHGYSTTDYYQIDPRLGSNQLYAQYSKLAQAKGIGTIKDMILNHIGLEHVWMKDMPSSDWINHGTTFVPTTHRRETLHDPHSTAEDRLAFTDGWFVPTMPDLNQRNPYLATYLIQKAIWWVEYADLTGIRVDTYSYSDKEFLAQWNRAILDEYPNLTIVGEEWSVNPAITAYWQAGSKRYDDYVSALPSVMDFPLQTTLVKALLDEETWGTGLVKLHEIIASDFLYGDPYKLVIFPDNHDMGRIKSQLGDDEDLFNMALTFFATMRGIPQFFYGTEIGMSNLGNDDHGIIRSPFPGGFAGDSVNAITGVGLSPQAKQTQDYVKWLLNFRKKSPAITAGKMIQYAPKNGVYTFFRVHPEQTIMVVLNKNDTQQSFDPTSFPTMLHSAKTFIHAHSGKSFSRNTLAIPGRSAQVFIVQ